MPSKESARKQREMSTPLAEHALSIVVDNSNNQAVVERDDLLARSSHDGLYERAARHRPHQRRGVVRQIHVARGPPRDRW